MAVKKAMIHLIVDPQEIPLEYEGKVCAEVDLYENGEKVMGSYRVNYDDLTPAEQQQFDDVVTMLNAKQP